MSNDNGSSAPVADTGAANTETTEVNEGAEQTPEQIAAAGVPKARNVKKFKLKVDGEEFDEEFDLDDEEGLKRHFQMSKVSQKRMSEAAKVRKQAEDFMGSIRKDFTQILKKPEAFGLTAKEAREQVEQWFASQIEDELMSPEQKKVRDADRIIREHEENRKRTETEEQDRMFNELKSNAAQNYDKTISEALSSSGLPKTPKTVKRMAELMHKNLSMGLELEPKHLVQMVREDYLSEIKELFGQTDGDAMISMLGDDVANKIRKADLARLKGQGLNKSAKKQETPQSNGSQPRAMTTEEYLAAARKRAGL